MSLSKLQLIEDNYRRDSFGDRVCDNLSEVILQFLPIKDKFRFECVSKQFQKTVYQRHYELIIGRNESIKELTFFGKIIQRLRNVFQRHHELIPTEDNRVDTNRRINVGILKKLPNIKSLVPLIALKDSDIDLIIKYCNHLNEFNGCLGGLSETSKQLFAERFGSQLTSLPFIDLSYKSIVNSLVNIREIEIKSNVLLYYKRVFNDLMPLIRTKSLKKLSIDWLIDSYGHIYGHNKNSIDFQASIDYIESVTHLEIYYVSENDNTIDDRFVSQLNQLISLRIIAKNKIKSLANVLNQFSDNCPKLKKLSLDFNDISEPKDCDFMSEVKKFKALKRFDFHFRGYSANYFQFGKYLKNSLKTGFQNITHLHFGLDTHIMSETFLQNIVINLPKIQVLVICNKIKTTERTADIVSPLSSLQHLTLRVEDHINQDQINSIKNRVIEKCRKIKSMDIFKH